MVRGEMFHAANSREWIFRLHIFPLNEYELIRWEIPENCAPHQKPFVFIGKLLHKQNIWSCKYSVWIHWIRHHFILCNDANFCIDCQSKCVVCTIQYFFFYKSLWDPHSTRQPRIYKWAQRIGIERKISPINWTVLKSIYLKFQYAVDFGLKALIFY